MRVAVVSDVHANAHALEAVLAAIAGERPDEIWHLGDAVGYGPRPNEACSLIREHAAIALVGNHDLVALDAADVSVEEFNPDAAAAAMWTRRALTDETAAWLRRLEPTAEAAGAALFHASPFDPVWGYVLSHEAAVLSLQLTSAPIVLVGHSHVPLAIHADGDQIGGGHAPAGTDVDLTRARWLLNPGSVGQPRDGDPRAAWLALDLAAGSARFHRVEYAISSTQAEMQAAKLPPALAERIAHGV